LDENALPTPNEAPQIAKESQLKSIFFHEMQMQARKCKHFRAFRASNRFPLAGTVRASSIAKQ
jgi:hypothetical protein